jgi:hypothetical protein
MLKGGKAERLKAEPDGRWRMEKCGKLKTEILKN